MTTAPSPPNLTAGDVFTEARSDAFTSAVDFLRTPPIGQFGRDADQSINSSTHTAVIWTTETRDSVSGHDLVTNPSRYTAQYDGVYVVSAAVPFAAHSAACKYELWFRRNGDNNQAFNGNDIQKSTTSHTLCPSSTREIDLSTGDYIEVMVWQDSGSARNIDSGFHGGPNFDIRWAYAL